MTIISSQEERPTRVVVGGAGSKAVVRTSENLKGYVQKSIAAQDGPNS
jgi:hypothetical protein